MSVARFNLRMNMELLFGWIHGLNLFIKCSFGEELRSGLLASAECVAKKSSSSRSLLYEIHSFVCSGCRDAWYLRECLCWIGYSRGDG